MRDKITYEWVFEPCDKYGDIIDPQYETTLAEAMSWSVHHWDDFHHYDVALCAFWGNSQDGETDRQYAYINDSGLPVNFEGGHRVPLRFQKEYKASSL